MFSKKPHADIKKSSQKATDPKKDSPTRHKHLKIILDNADPAESKLFFESYFSHVYFVFYDIFLTTEANLKLKVQKSYRDDLDGILQLLEKILILLPELLQKKWQCHSISRVMRKILHPANSVKLRREGIRLFLIWYQILGDHAPDDLHLLFTSLVPDIPVLADYTNPGATSVNPSRPLGLTYAPNYPGREAVDNLSYSSYGSETSGGHSAQHFQESEVGAVLPFDSSCLLPPQPGERSPDNVTTFYLETLMELMISQVTKIEWRDKGTFRQQWCFQFLFDKFKKYYMPHIFPRFDITLNLYRPLPTLPTLRSEDNVIISTDLVDSTMAISGANFGAGMAVAASGQSPPGSPHSALHPHHPQYHQQQLVLQERLAQCQVTIIRWVANFTHNVKKPLTNLEVSRSQVDASVDGNQSEPPSTGQGNDQTAPESVGSGSGAHGSSSVTTLSTTSLIDRESNASFPTVEDHLHFEHMIVRNTLYANRDNVNFVHKVFHQAFLLPFNYSRAIKRVIECYKDWIQMNLSELPVFMLEPLEVNRDDQVHFANQSSASAAVQRQQETSATASETSVVPTTNTNSSFLSVQDVIPRGWRIRNDSYLSAIQLDQLNVRAGLQNMLHIFITNASNLFLLEIGEDRPHALLEEQVDMCKRVLNVYRFMVMNVRMERNTWEQLLNILLRVTSLVLKEHPPSKKEASLGGRLAPALFQTLIVTWIKANLNVVITPELWCNFLSVLSSLTQWEELIREWAKTMETLTRVLARQVYGLDLNDLPLERLSEQKQKKRRGRMHPGDGIKSAGQISTATEDSRTGRGSDASESVPLQRQRIARFNDKVSSSFENGGSDGKEMMTNQSATHERMPRDRLDSNFSFDRESGFVYGKAGHVGSFALVRSNSDGNLTLKKGRRPSLRSSSRESSVTSDGHHRHSHRHHRRMIVEGISPALEQEVERIISNAEEYVRANKQSGYRRDRPFLVKRKSRSVESLSHYHGLDTPPLSVDYSSGAGTPDRSPSPAPSTGIDSNSFKDSPMNLEVIGSSDNSCSNSDVGVEQRSVMAGGNVRGWLPDVAVVLWRRMLGALGDINVIKNPEIHAQVMKYLTDLFETMLKLRNNLGVTSDNQSTPQSPELIPPVTLIIPWLFKTLLLDDDYKEGKLYAYRLLCTLTVRKHDVPLPRQHIVEFYRVLHRGLVGHDQQIINTIVKFCTSRFFFCDLPGSTLLLLDFIFAANTIASSSELENTPRTEAISLLGSLLCFPLHYKTFPVFKPNVSEPTVMACNDAKDHLISVLLKSGKKEPAGLARCIAISSIGIFIYEELIHRSFHVRVKEAIGVLLTGLRLNNRVVAQVTCDMLLLLRDQIDVLLPNYPDIPNKIVHDLCATLQTLLPQRGNIPCDADKKLMISMLFCIGEWCMSVPRKILVQTIDGSEALLHTVFKVLKLAAAGGYSNDGVRDATSVLSDLSSQSAQDFDLNIQLDNLSDDWSNVGSSDRSDQRVSFQTSSSNAYFDGKSDDKVLRLAARVVMSYVVNHVGHFPMGIGASRLGSMVSEHDDLPWNNAGVVRHRDELSTDIFDSPSVQLFILNNVSLISLIEIPTLEVPGGGAMAGLTKAKSQVRVILRDLTGKFAWDAYLLYSETNDDPKDYQPRRTASTPTRHRQSSITASPDKSQKARSNSSPQQQRNAASKRQFLTAMHVTNEHTMPSSSIVNLTHSASKHVLRSRQIDVLPTTDDSIDDFDNLNDMLRYIGHSSPECLLNSDCDLNVPTSAPCDLNAESENEIVTTVLNQHNSEIDHTVKHSLDNRMRSNPVKLPVHKDGQYLVSSLFQHCRLLLTQLGLITWDKRPHFDLLKKNEKLIRELKNLDSQKCRETHKIAVIYVAEGQEDKNSVLLNYGGSQDYEEFVSGLAWEVELETHAGFMGGLQKNRSTGDTAPYYSTPFVEVIFHVATRMPTNNEDSFTKKLRHLGNDEIHIVWSEHTRDYRRGIIATEFCDVLIVIYPLPSNLFRIQISSKPEVPYFGPLFNGAIVDRLVLPGLVRATAINASRAKRSLIPLFQNFYEERARSLDTIKHNNKDTKTFEEFASYIYSPVQVKSSRSGRHSTVEFRHLADHEERSTGSTNLLEVQPFNENLTKQRPMSLSSGTDKLQSKSASGGNFSPSSTARSASYNVPSSSSSTTS